MQSSSVSGKNNRHYAAIFVAAALLVLLVFEVASFGFSAYYVFNEPISNVVAQTYRSGPNTYVNVTATGLNASAVRMVWIDPQFTTGANGSVYVNATSGIKIGNSTTDSSGGLSGTFPISNSELNQITSDGRDVQSVWIIGLTGSSLRGSPQYLGVTYDAEQNYSIATVAGGITLFVTLITFVVPFNFNLGQLFLVLWTIYIILFAMALNGPFRNLFGAIRAASRKGVSGLMDNSMFATLLTFPVVLWATVLLAEIQQAGGVSTGSLPPLDSFLEFVSLSIAPLREELGFRVIPIGVAALLVLLVRGRFRDGLLALWHPARYLKKNDSPQEYRRHLYLMYVMIAVSALLFGAAHVLLGAGWGPGKFLDAAVAGVGLGALYYVYGFPATVLLHWSIDVFLTVYVLSPQLLNAGDFIALYSEFLAVVGSIVFVLLLIRKFRKPPAGVYESNWGSSVG